MPANVLRTEVVYANGISSHETMNVLHWKKADDSDWEGADVADFGDEFLASLEDGDSLKDCVCGNVSIDRLDMTILADPPIGPFTKALGVEGTLTGEAAPPQVAILVDLRAFGFGRSGHGRMYLPAFDEGAISPQGTIEPGQAEGLRVNISTQVGALFDEGYRFCVYSRVNDEAYEINNVSVQTQVATQKRRVGRRL